MIFVLQDPSDPAVESLHEALLSACENATSGGGAFAFASADGVSLLLGDDVFQRFARQHPFGLVVGIDAITNVASLDALAKAKEEAPGLTVQVFLHRTPRSLFHPKVCWFRTADGGVAVTGSGNLTMGGLRYNWEAFTVDAFNVAAAETLEAGWRRWLEASQEYLLPLDNEEVRARAARNADREYRRGHREDEGGDIILPAETPVLIAEIPKNAQSGGIRTLRQANFHRATFVDFFGAREGRQRRVLLQQFGSEAVESRPAVITQSRNYRFELAAGQHIPYPDDEAGRPIGVFAREAGRRFRYALVVPGDPGYLEVEAYLTDRVGLAVGNNMREVETNLPTLQRLWPNRVF